MLSVFKRENLGEQNQSFRNENVMR